MTEKIYDVEIAPLLLQVGEICQKHGVQYRSDTWSRTLTSVLGELRRLSAREASVAG